MKTIKSIMIAVALIAVWGCSSDNEGDVTNNNGQTQMNGYWVEKVEKAPTWSTEFSMPKKNIGQLPALEQVNFYMFESNMTAILHMQSELASHFSEDDLMVAVVDGEVREIANLLTYQDDEDIAHHAFMLLIPFDNNDEWVDIYYYNKASDHTYVTPQAFRVQNDTVDSGTEFVYELFNEVELALTLPSTLPFAPAADDQLAVFVGDTCCGVGTYEPTTKQWDVTAFNLLEGQEKAHVRYYSARQKAIYRTSDFIDFSSSISEDETTMQVLTFL